MRTAVLLCSIVLASAVGCVLDRRGQLSAGASGGAGSATTTDGGGGGVVAPNGGTGGVGGTGAVGAIGAGGGGGDGGTGGSGGSGQGGGFPPIERAGDLLVVLDALDASAGSATWQNGGTLGDFVERGDPSLGQYNGVTAVQFDGVDDAYEGPITPSTLEAASDRSIEVWACNPGITSEETLVAWGNRGGPVNTNLTFNYGNSTSFGAVGHWANDMGWGASGPPPADQWHHLAYVYSGTEAIVYADAVEKNTLAVTLATHAGYSINIATQREGELEFAHAGSLWIAVVRVHSEALTPSQLSTNFNLERNRFGL
jgi:hypothetical protein